MSAMFKTIPMASGKIFGVEGGRMETVDRVQGRIESKGDWSIEDQRSPCCEGNLRIIDVIAGSGVDGDVMCVQYSHDGRLLAAGYSSGVIKVFGVTDNRRRCLHVLKVSDLVRLPVTCIRFLSPGSGETRARTAHLLAASYASGFVRLWHYTSGSCLHVLAEGRASNETLSLAFSPDDGVFATVGADPSINLYDAKTNRSIRTFEATDSRDLMDGHRCRVYAVQFHPTEEHVFLTGGWDNTVQFWDDREAHSVRKIYGPHICGDALDIDRLYGHILTGSWRKDEALQIWDFGSGEMIKDVPQDPNHVSQLYCAQWLGCDDIVCAGSSQNLMRIVNRATLDTIGSVVDLPNGAFCLDNDGLGPNPQLAAGAGTHIYIVQTETPI